jgi:hypothetical protein
MHSQKHAENSPKREEKPKMAETKWTPGLWEVHGTVKGSYGIFSPCSKVAVSAIVSAHPEHKANANLIAAAPELYEALEALEALDDGDEPFAWDHAKLFDAARKALAKAREEQLTSTVIKEDPDSK